MRRSIWMGIALGLLAAAPARGDGIELASVKTNEGVAAAVPGRVQLTPRGAGHYYNRGNAFFHARQFDRAIAEYGRAIRQDPRDVDALIARAAAYYYIADYARALRDWGTVIRLTPDSAAAYGNRAWTYCQLGRADKGLVDAAHALQLKPYGDGYAARACNHDVSGNVPAAIRDYEKALGLAPDHSEAADWRQAIDRLRRRK